MTYEEVVKEAQKIVAKGDASGIKDHLAVQYNITGEGEGAFYMEVKDGHIDVQPYDYKDRDILVTADAKTILDMITAEGDLGKADILKKLINSGKKAEKAAAKAEKKSAKATKKSK